MLHCTDGGKHKIENGLSTNNPHIPPPFHGPSFTLKTDASLCSTVKEHISRGCSRVSPRLIFSTRHKIFWRWPKSRSFWRFCALCRVMQRRQRLSTGSRTFHFNKTGHGWDHRKHGWDLSVLLDSYFISFSRLYWRICVQVCCACVGFLWLKRGPRHQLQCRHILLAC